VSSTLVEHPNRIASREKKVIEWSLSKRRNGKHLKHKKRSENEKTSVKRIEKAVVERNLRQPPGIAVLTITDRK